jgi:signal transduction histidine kinase
MFLRSPKHIYQTLSFRLTVGSSLLFILSSLDLFGFAYFLISSSLHERDRAAIQLKLKEYSGEYQSGGLAAVERKVNSEHSSLALHPFLVRVAGPKNETMLLQSSEDEDRTDFDLKRLERSDPGGKDGWIRLKAETEDDVLDIASLRLANGWFLQVGKGPDEREDVLDSFRTTFAVLLLAGTALALAGGVVLARQTLRPVRGLITGLRPIIETGKTSARVPVRHTGDELEELSLLFNQALEKIERLIEGMRASLDNVAHDLRTPMARLRGIAEIALQSGANQETYREALADCLEESEQVLAMLNTLMDISEVEAGSVRLDLRKLNILPLLNKVDELYRSVAEDKSIALHTSCPEDLWLAADRNRILQVMANLLDNAIKYTPSGGTVNVSASPRDGEVVLAVQDTGIGISPEEINRVWDRFYRGDKSRAHRGLGLGLSLVKAVVQAHRGTVEVMSEPGIGSQFTVCLPRNCASTD